MGLQIIIKKDRPYRYYLKSVIMGDFYEVNEAEFWGIVGHGRHQIVKVCPDAANANRQNYFMNHVLIGYREK